MCSHAEALRDNTDRPRQELRLFVSVITHAADLPR